MLTSALLNYQCRQECMKLDVKTSGQLRLSRVAIYIAIHNCNNNTEQLMIIWIEIHTMHFYNIIASYPGHPRLYETIHFRKGSNKIIC